MLVPRGLHLLAAALILPLLATPASAVAADPVPVVLGDPVAETRAVIAARATFTADPMTADVTIRHANPRAVRPDADRLQLDLGTGQLIQLRQDWSAPTDDSVGVIWAGRVGTGDDAVTLVRRGDDVTGSVRVGADRYRIQPVPGIGHAVIRVNEDALPPDHPQDAPDAVSKPFTFGPQRATAAPNTVIRVLVAASKTAIAAHTGDFKAVVDLAMSETQQGYRSGDIAIDLELAEYVPTEYTDSGNMGSDLSALKGKSDGKLDELHAKRDQTKADVVVMITEKASACGVAASIGASESSAFAIVTRKCATGYYTFGHEIGHLQGAAHNKAQNSNPKYAYGHGYMRDGKWRTVMSYDCPKKCKRVLHWSNPRKQYEGEALGTTSTEDNARVLNETAKAVGAFRS